ncbi:hypothetical protein A2797_01115 [candidate division WWE3 bacterium RIFCSPHIGHO2_01_FULL_48_15]|uniref:Adenylate kinase n=1 Tax=candidate division WWE3 bacterium RIFCSPHIGHO2_01_FULL_48_15 TaxID=1802619 RepID=A0A1F4VER6_UNCKA|nr:MAG: hypothetical protein A2797_01115 [candidate division WWE3 bacterium RIFCSPHIGHO2_01_FULL_48_15]
MAKAAIVLMGPSGVGKGTQAFRLTKCFPGFIHFDTGQEIKKRVDDLAFALDPNVTKQREIYYRGDLNDTRWATALVCEKIKAYALEGFGIILSGSPRTVYEAEQIGPLVKEIFGQNVLIIKINVSEDAVRQRMASRVVCNNAFCGFPSTKEQIARLCPQCGKGKLAPKSLDSEEAIRRRIAWFYTQTIPALSNLYLLGIPLVEVDGEGDEERVFSQILVAIEENLAL